MPRVTWAEGAAASRRWVAWSATSRDAADTRNTGPSARWNRRTRAPGPIPLAAIASAGPCARPERSGGASPPRRSASVSAGYGTKCMTMPLANHIANSTASGMPSQRCSSTSGRIISFRLPPERGGELVGARRSEIDLVLVARVREGGVDPVRHIAHPEREARGVDRRHAKVPAGNVDEGEEVRGRERIHRGRVVLEHETAPDGAHGAADLDRPAPLVPAIGRPSVDDEGRDVRRRVAGERVEFLVARMRQGDVAPELPAVERPHGGGELDALRVDLARDGGDRVGDLHIHVPPDDIVGGERPFGPLVPEQLLDARLVDPGAGQFQGGAWLDREDAPRRRIERRGGHRV